VPQQNGGRSEGRIVAARDVKDLADALKEAFRTVNDLEALTLSLDQRFDDLTSRSKPQGENAWDIASQAFSKGWAGSLLAGALRLQPDNPRLRALWDRLPEGADQVPLDDFLDERPSLLCGRSDQWGGVVVWAAARQHQTILVHGANGQAPEHFKERVFHRLDTRPDRSILLVDWPSRPANRDAYFEALAKALNVVDVALLSEAIASRLAVENLVLLHPLIMAKFRDPGLVKYYTQWLPELLNDSPNSCKLKCVQPIEWQPEPGRSLLSWLRGTPPRDGAEDSARWLISQLKDGFSASMPIVELKELDSLEDPELDGFVQGSGLTRKQQARMLEEVKSVPPVPEVIFKTIDDVWQQVEAIQ